LHRLSDRFPVHVIVWPVAVQGEGAKEQIAEAIAGFNAANIKPDLLIIARGGGSIEDLWAFNEEIVVRAAASSTIPIISAVGHETDTTLIDYVSDRRAPTPTAAAEMAVPVRDELLGGIRQLESRLRIVATRLFENISQRLDDWSERLTASLPQMLKRKSQQLAVAAATLTPRVLYAELKTIADKLLDSEKRLQLSLQRLLDRNQEKIMYLSAMLESVNYQKILARGFALVRDEKGALVSSVFQAKQASGLSLAFKDGEMFVKIK
jgi:exodeoxyribonuclease VII large subunit